MCFTGRDKFEVDKRCWCCGDQSRNFEVESTETWRVPGVRKQEEGF